MICNHCGRPMELDGIGYICDPPNSVKLYLFKCLLCKHEQTLEAPI